MVIGMAKTEKVTVTLPIEQVAAIRALVEGKRVASVSGFLQHAVGLALEDVVEFERMLDEDLEASGGPLTDEEIRWADGILGHGPRVAMPKSMEQRRAQVEGRGEAR
jgi:Arc/MetJ-type ribon-helix-helix transcriptional regulator